MMWRHPLRTGLVVIVTTAALAGCSGAQEVPEQEAPERQVMGPCQDVFGGQVCTWGTLTDGRATEFGATVAMATVENTPMEGEMVFPPVSEAIVPLPAEVAAATGFDHLGVNWELHGHPPALFMTPHFDFHFYTIGADRIDAIDCSDTRKPEALPAGYALPDIDIPGMGTLVGLCVPHMGMHGMPSAELDKVEPFDASMIVGYYGGELIFLEPMIARATLAGAQSFEMAMPPAPPNAAATLQWPVRFDASYDADARVYRLVFSLQNR
jgi:hypothetical protein